MTRTEQDRFSAICDELLDLRIAGKLTRKRFDEAKAEADRLFGSDKSYMHALIQVAPEEVAREYFAASRKTSEAVPA